MDALNNRPWQRDYTIKQTLLLAETPMVVNVSAEDCQLLTVQGPGAYDFRRLPKLDGK